MKFFSLFSVSQNSFEGKKDYEQVLVLLYRHWFVLLARMIVYAILFLLPFLVWFVGQSYLEIWGLDLTYWFLVSVYMAVWWLGLFYTLTMYFLDTWVVTDHRILDNEQHGYFNRSVSELHLSRIQDVSVSVSGPISTFLDFGDLEIQTAGTEPKFFFKEIPHPNQVRDLIMHAQSQFVASHPGDVEVHEIKKP